MAQIRYKSGTEWKNLLLVFYPVGSQSSVSYASTIGGTWTQKSMGDPWAAWTTTGANYNFTTTETSFNESTWQLGTTLGNFGSWTSPDSYVDWFSVDGNRVNTVQNIPYICLGRIIYNGSSGVHCCFGLVRIQGIDWSLCSDRWSLGTASTQNFWINIPFNYILDGGPAAYAVVKRSYSNSGAAFISGMSHLAMKPLCPREYWERTA